METNYRFELLKFRAKHFLTQKQLADILGVSVLTVNRTENKKTEPSKRNKIIYENKMKEWEEKKNVSL